MTRSEVVTPNMVYDNFFSTINSSKDFAQDS